MWFGRAAHLRGVARWLAEVAGGGGSVLGVEGETGSGKTELSRFAAAAARRLGFRVLGVGGSPFESGAAGQLVRRLCGTSDPDEVHRRVLDESRSGPVLLVVDDLQWCDPESAICLAFLARRLPGLRIGLLVCRLPGVAVGDPVPAGELFRDLPRDARIELGALDDGTADAVVAASLPAAPAGVRAAVRRWTGNNPYLLAEVLAVLTRCGDPLPEVADVVPASVAAWLLRHLGGDLPVARALAVLPGEAGADEVARVAGMPVFEVEPALGRLVALGLVRRGRGAAFRQPLVRAAVLDTTPPAERVALVLRGARPLRDRDLVGYLLTSGVADHPEVCAPLTAAVRRVVAESTGGDRSALLRGLLAHRVSVPARVEFLRLLAAAELDRSPTAALACLDEAAGLAADRRSLAVDRARALHLLDRGAEAVP
ncbi:AAA family ATPase, partial [Actinosynnema sp. NPDC059797]